MEIEVPNFSFKYWSPKNPRIKITIKANEEEEISSKGLMVLPMRMGLVERDVVFQVLDLPLEYNILLGRP